jgi:hypothetical protein
MKNSNGLEESKGVVLFAYNTEFIDYVAIADANAKLITKHLKLPVTLVTDIDSNPSFKYDKVIRIENTLDNFRNINFAKQTWRNGGRSLAYDLSPYDTTILLDSDYLILDNSLLTFTEQTFDYKLQHTSYSEDGILYSRMGVNYSLPFVWATCVVFKKTQHSKLFFDFVQRIERNYKYYKTLFKAQGTFRNDHAFAMADIVLNGYTWHTSRSMPNKIFTVESDIESIEIKNNFIFIKHHDRAVVSPVQNIHIMDKQYLQTDSFKQFVEKVCNDMA